MIYEWILLMKHIRWIENYKFPPYVATQIIKFCLVSLPEPVHNLRMTSQHPQMQLICTWISETSNIHHLWEFLIFLCHCEVTRILSGTQYTHHNLKHMLPQYCTTYNDVFLLITSTKA